MAPIPAPPRAVVFDLDGTLLDSYAAIHECLSLVLAAFARPPVTPDETRRMVGHGLEVLVARAVGSENVEAGVKIFRSRYEQVGPENSTLLPGADAVTRRLVEAGIPIAIASNKPARFSREILEQLGISNFFRHVFVSSELGADKPDPEIFRRALGVVDLPSDQVVHVGDDPESDWKAASAVGLSIFQLDRAKNSLRDLLASL